MKLKAGRNSRFFTGIYTVGYWTLCNSVVYNHCVMYRRSERDAVLSLEGALKKTVRLFNTGIHHVKILQCGDKFLNAGINSRKHAVSVPDAVFLFPEKEKNMRNQDIRTAMQRDGIALWRVAEILGIHYNTLRNWLRKDLDAEKRQEIIAAVQTAKDKRDIEEGWCKC